MKNKISHSLLLMLVGVLSIAVAEAQPGYHNKGGNGNRYEDESRDYNKNGHHDRGEKDYNNNRNDRYYQAGYVKHRPNVSRNVISARPSLRHTWVGEDWIFTRGEYRYKPGYWVIPARGQQFVQGRWERARNGWYWVPGYWTRSGYRS